MPLPIPLILSLAKPILDKITSFIPDNKAKQKAKLQIEKELIKFAADTQTAQAEINKEQAKHKSVFVAGARPFIMWICGAGMAFQYIAHPLLMWAWALFGVDGTAPEPMDMGSLMPLLMGMLGLGGMRSFDKNKGVQTDSIKGTEKR